MLAPLDFALGAVMVTRREQLAKIGGFEALADYLADDFQLGNRIVRIAGKRIALCPVVVDCLSRADELARGVGASTPLGAHHPRLQAAALRLQHSEQRHALAAALVCGVSIRMAGHHFGCVPCGARVCVTDFANPPWRCARAELVLVACAGERYYAIRFVGGRIFRQSHCLARPTFPSSI